MEKYVKEAFEQAKKGLEEGGIPIGAVLVSADGEILGKGHNRRVQDNDPILHAEIQAMRDAGRLGSFRGTTMYSTLMPCYMCAGAIVQFGISKVVAGESRNFGGAKDFLESNGVQVVDMDLDDHVKMLGDFIEENQALWYEDIGVDG
jgi:cytosine/creatinine deaminase